MPTHQLCLFQNRSINSKYKREQTMDNAETKKNKKGNMRQLYPFVYNIINKNRYSSRKTKKKSDILLSEHYHYPSRL